MDVDYELNVTNSMGEMTDEEESGPFWEWVVLCLISAISFWSQAFVTEEVSDIAFQKNI